jgi:hypothetical protein
MIPARADFIVCLTASIANVNRVVVRVRAVAAAALLTKIINNTCRFYQETAKEHHCHHRNEYGGGNCYQCSLHWPIFIHTAPCAVKRAGSLDALFCAPIRLSKNCAKKSSRESTPREGLAIIADNLSKAGWSLGWVSAIDCEGRTIWIADAHRGDGKRFVVGAAPRIIARLPATILQKNLADLR